MSRKHGSSSQPEPEITVKNEHTLLSHLFFYFFAFSAQAYEPWENLKNIFVKENYSVEQANSNVEIAKLKSEQYLDNFLWNLELSGQFKDNKLEERPFFRNANDELETYTLSLTKSTSLGSEFSLANTLDRSENRGVAASFFGSPTEIDGFNQSVSLSQSLGKNFFGRKFRLEANLFKFEQSIAKFEKDEIYLTEVKELFSTYLEVLLVNELIDYQKSAVARASERQKLISKRVEEGFREKIDSYQSQLSLLHQKEQFEALNQRKEVALVKLGTFFHGDPNSLNLGTLSDIPSLKLPKGKMEENISIIKLKEEESALSQKIKLAQYDFLPSVTLSAAYTTNDFDPSTGRAIRHGSLGSDNKSVQVGLNVKMPLGFEVEKKNRAIARSNLVLKRSQIAKQLQNYSLEIATISKQLGLVEDKLKINLEKVAFSKKVLQQQQENYLKGKANFDQVLTAEENLIQNQKSQSEFLVEKLNLLNSLYFLFGKEVSWDERESL